MLQDLEFDDSDSPAIGLVPPGVSWTEVRDHIKIAHPRLLVPPADGDKYAGAYWTGTDMAVVQTWERTRTRRSRNSAITCKSTTKPDLASGVIQT